MTHTIPAPYDELLVDDSAITDRVIADSRDARAELLAAMAGTRAARTEPYTSQAGIGWRCTCGTTWSGARDAHTQCGPDGIPECICYDSNQNARADCLYCRPVTR